MATVITGVVASRTGLLHARAITVEGEARLSRARVVSIAGLDRRTNVLWFDEGAAERRLEADPWVADAEIGVGLPWTIEIAIREREPVAVVSDRGEEVLVAADGTALGPPWRSAVARRLPRIDLGAVRTVEGATRDPAGAAIAIGAMAPDLRARVSRVAVLLDGTLEVWLRSGPRIRYGAPTGVRPKAAAIARALAWATEEGERILTLSVVSPVAPAATLAP